MKTSLGLGKYRDLLLAILLFIVLDLGILFFNFFASIQLERDASRINTAGELRMLTQQITKSLLTLQTEQREGLPIQTSMAQLGQGTAGFNEGLAALKASTAYCAKAHAVSDAAIHQEITIWGEKRSKLWALVTNAAHDDEHYGNIVTYLRMNGMVPPSSRGQ